jgi:hypothetical protein
VVRNEWLGWFATVVSLDPDGWDVVLDDESAFRFVMDVADRCGSYIERASAGGA